MKYIFICLFILPFFFSCNHGEKPKAISHSDSVFSKASIIQQENPVFGSEDFINVYNSYKEILKADSLNFSANYNIGILFYNQAVNKIVSTDSIAYTSLFYNESSYEMPFTAFFDTLKLSQVTQDREIRSWFNTAQKYFERAYKKDTTALTLIMGLQGCYHFFGDSVNFKRMGNKINNRKDSSVNYAKGVSTK